jgi:uncharacterized damage-inducible protein DinB
VTDALLDVFRYNCWATQRLLEHCAALDESQLTASAPGVFGAPIATLEHLLRAEAFYVSMFRDEAPAWSPAGSDQPVTIAQMQAWAADLRQAWEAALAEPVPAERMLARRRRDGSITEMSAGIMLSQTLHHANVHREQVCNVLTSLGLEPPDLSAWAYARER